MGPQLGNMGAPIVANSPSLQAPSRLPARIRVVNEANSPTMSGGTSTEIVDADSSAPIAGVFKLEGTTDPSRSSMGELRVWFTRNWPLQYDDYTVNVPPGPDQISMAGLNLDMRSFPMKFVVMETQ